MPQTKFEKLFFMFLTVLISVFSFTTYNIATALGGMSNKVFLLALKEVPLEFIIAFLLEALVANRLSIKLASKLVDFQKDKEIVIIMAITAMTICIMCPLMSIAATIIYNGVNLEFVANLFQKIRFNFPFAFFSQIFFIGPFVRFIFNGVFRKNKVFNY